MNQDTFKPFVQELVNAARPSNDETAREAQEKAAIVVNSIGTMVQPKRDTRKKYAFDEAIDLVANGFKAAREARANRVQENPETDTEKPTKSLAELLAESAQDDE